MMILSTECNNYHWLRYEFFLHPQEARLNDERTAHFWLYEGPGEGGTKNAGLVALPHWLLHLLLQFNPFHPPQSR